MSRRIFTDEQNQDAVSKLARLSDYMRRHPALLASDFPLVEAERALADEEWIRRGAVKISSDPASSTKILSQADPALDSPTGKLQSLTSEFTTVWLPRSKQTLDSKFIHVGTARQAYTEVSEGIKTHILGPLVMLNAIEAKDGATAGEQGRRLLNDVNKVQADLDQALQRIGDSQRDLDDDWTTSFVSKKGEMKGKKVSDLKAISPGLTTAGRCRACSFRLFVCVPGSQSSRPCPQIGDQRW